MVKFGYSQINFASSALRSVGDSAAGSRGSLYITFVTVTLKHLEHSNHTKDATKDTNQSPTGRWIRLFVSKGVARSLVFASIQNEQTSPSHDRQTRHVGRRSGSKIDLTASGEKRYS